jgi:hypothetical protein
MRPVLPALLLAPSTIATTALLDNWWRRIWQWAWNGSEGVERARLAAALWTCEVAAELPLQDVHDNLQGAPHT